MKAVLFHKFKTYVERKYFGLGIQIVSLFLYRYVGTYRELAFKAVSTEQCVGSVSY